jgi:glycosyltransferase involved in cell wall biosynthesis
MTLKDKKICFVLAFKSPYGGNLISSLECLAQKLQAQGCTVMWIFPEQTKKDWLIQLEKTYSVYYIKSSYKESQEDFYKFFQRYHVDLVHTHFEKYDESVAKACIRIKWEIKQVWHIHDYLDYNGNLLNKIKCHFSYYRHYYIYGKKAYLIPISNEMANFCDHYRQGKFYFPAKTFNKKVIHTYKRSSTVINGIMNNRIHKSNNIHIPREPFVFLSYGGINTNKRIEILAQACKILYEKGYNIKLKLTKGIGTTESIIQTLGTINYDWLEIITQTENINSLLEQASCYVSTSIKETMSMAIAEATIFGKPVIQSDIAGTWWNAQNPSTYLFKSKNLEDLVKTMELLINTPNEQIIEKCKITQERNSNLLNINLWCDKIISIYNKL